MKKLEIKNLHVSVGDKEILKGINLTIGENEVHALMGPNGNGKSTLLAAIMGNPTYTVTEGSIFYDDKDVLAMPVNKRSIAGLFLAMQYPQEVPGVTNSDFLRAAMNARRDKPVSLFTFIKTMEKTIQDLQMKEDLAHRFLNEGFSGGEKKRNEIVQMEMLRPSLSMLDEIDSGLDVDAMHVVAKAINQLRQETKMSLIIVSHYDRFFTMIEPQFTHVLVDGKIALHGDGDLARRIDQEGYDWVYEEYGIIPPENVKPKVKPRSTLGSCAVKDMVSKGEEK
ncbi:MULTISPECIES: Fe-S cluster assembly ATPase SufC [Terrabacteria group]|uniref:Fe-S cluster assembly ATPase SufC n=1 Tax=Bacillati TaxID=1783272 RepID=UPI001C6F12FB|nr:MULTISPECIES: Fe-S cluster assembly ATPase SufC [Terrabacteria group]MBW9212358.1 Fe-S cluster assembly ATPase SufC [Trueperella sp. zg.1013]